MRNSEREWGMTKEWKKERKTTNRLKWLIAHRWIVATTVFEKCMPTIVYSLRLITWVSKRPNRLNIVFLRLWSFSLPLLLLLLLLNWCCLFMCGVVWFQLMARASRQQLNHYQVYVMQLFRQCFETSDQMCIECCWIRCLVRWMWLSAPLSNGSLETRMHRGRAIAMALCFISEGQHIKCECVYSMMIICVA